MIVLSPALTLMGERPLAPPLHHHTARPSLPSKPLLSPASYPRPTSPVPGQLARRESLSGALGPKFSKSTNLDQTSPGAPRDDVQGMVKVWS